jgi:hypothetical protein
MRRCRVSCPCPRVVPVGTLRGSYRLASRSPTGQSGCGLQSLGRPPARAGVGLCLIGSRFGHFWVCPVGSRSGPLRSMDSCWPSRAEPNDQRGNWRTPWPDWHWQFSAGAPRLSPALVDQNHRGDRLSNFQPPVQPTPRLVG